MNNLLVDEWLRAISTTGQVSRLSLPGLLAALQKDEVASFPALLPHQAHSWHAFLCQLASMALEGEALPPFRPGEPSSLLGQDDEGLWAKRLRALTPGFPGDEPWQMVVEDLSLAAFFQPPVPERKLTGFNPVASPDDIDILETARNHGVKQGRVLQSGVEHWVLALISVQTQGGYSIAGSGYRYACTVRQNSSYGTRPGISLVSSNTPGGQWARDVRVILERPESFDDHAVGFDRQGMKLVWLEPWDGVSGLTLDRLHPLFIEVCRRLRLTRVESGWICHRKGSKGPRVIAEQMKGNLADPWIPIRLGEGAAFNSRPRYRAIQSVLFGFEDYQPSLLQEPTSFDQGELAVRFRVLSRGQSKTEGYHERVISVPRPARGFLTGAMRRQAAAPAQSMVEKASAAEYKVLKPALLKLLQPAVAGVNYDQPETNAWADAFISNVDREIDGQFFDFLWQVLELVQTGADHAKALNPWVEFLRRRVNHHFDQAAVSLPQQGALSAKAVAQAELMLFGNLKKHLSLQEDN